MNLEIKSFFESYYKSPVLGSNNMYYIQPIPHRSYGTRCLALAWYRYKEILPYELYGKFKDLKDADLIYIHNDMKLTEAEMIRLIAFKAFI